MPINSLPPFEDVLDDRKISGSFHANPPPEAPQRSLPALAVLVITARRVTALPLPLPALGVTGLDLWLERLVGHRARFESLVAGRAGLEGARGAFRARCIEGA